jgi:hypothetical protein
MGYTITKGNYQIFFSEYITLLVNFSVGFLGTTNMQMILDLVHVAQSMFGVTLATSLMWVSGVEGH